MRGEGNSITESLTERAPRFGFKVRILQLWGPLRRELNGVGGRLAPSPQAKAEENL